MLKTRVAHGYCSRHLSADACPYAYICEKCDNFTTRGSSSPNSKPRSGTLPALNDDAEARGWDSEVAGHARVITSLLHHIDRLHQDDIPARQA